MQASSKDSFWALGQEIQQALAFLRTMDLRAVGQRTIERLFHALEMRYDFQLGAASCGEREENT